ncbi:MAG: glycosyltransferase family 4 protein [Gemmatimonadetes bacterium]|nr:glycosyltransferase family 4 protein [Gemmatimonadota bacterium]
MSVDTDRSFGVLHVSTDDVAGGAGRCAYFVHGRLRQFGVDSRMLVGRKQSDDPFVRPLSEIENPRAGIVTKARRFAGRRVRRLRSSAQRAGTEPFSDGRSQRDIQWTGIQARFGCSLVHLHRVEGMLDYGRFFRNLPSDLPIAWTLHDMNAFTGGCPYDFGCGRYRDRCGACPQIDSSTEEDASRRTWSRKRRLFARMDPDRLHLVAPSGWMAHQARHSSLFGERFRVSVIPNGVDTDAFAPRDTAGARSILGIPVDARVILFVSPSLANRRKGGAPLLEALGRVRLQLPDAQLLTLGKGNLGKSDLPHTPIGYTSDQRLLSVVYSAADVLVVPSLQDNLPTTVIEAMACGVPTVGFDVGGVPEMVRPGHTGALAPAGDAEALAEEILELLATPTRATRMGPECRADAVRRFSLDLQARRYSDLYAELLDFSASRSRAAEYRSGRALDRPPRRARS